MINRYLGTCATCRTRFLFRAVVPMASTDALRFCCPRCALELRAAITLDYSASRMDLDPSGFQLSVLIPDEPMPVVTVSTDLPVHRLKHTMKLTEGGSPFLLLVQEMGPSFIGWKSRVNALQSIRENSLTDISRIVEYMRLRRWDLALDRARELLHDCESSVDALSTIHACYRIIGVPYVPLFSPEEMIGTLDEYYEHLNNCMMNKRSAYCKLLQNWTTSAEFGAFRSKTFTAYLRAFAHFDSFYVGMMFTEMPENLRDRIDEFRIFRDDYNVVKSLYQDLFELISQLLMYIGAVVNLSKRGDPEHYATGARSFRAFQKARAVERFRTLGELPQLNRILGVVSRPMRNAIGHFVADYDACTGRLRYDDGQEVNYISFLGDFYLAIRALWIALVFVEKVDIDVCRLAIA